MQEQLQKYKDAQPAQVNLYPGIDLTTEEADTAVETSKAGTTITDEDEAMLVDYLTKENLQDPDEIVGVMEKEAAQTVPRPTSDQISSKLNFIPSRDQIVPKPLSIPNSNNAASLLDKADGQIMPKPNSIPSRDQIVPKSVFIPNPDDPVNLMEKAADVTGKDTFTATFTVSGGILIQPKTLETHGILVKHFQYLNLYS
ncbi:hypothetical protein ACLKA7_005203 [Drosophila subpalustris]